MRITLHFTCDVKCKQLHFQSTNTAGYDSRIKRCMVDERARLAFSSRNRISCKRGIKLDSLFY